MTAAPSRRCATRLPAISVSFLMAFMAAIGSVPRGALPPCPVMAWVMAWARRCLVDPHGAVLGAERGDVFHQGRG